MVHRRMDAVIAKLQALGELADTDKSLLRYALADVRTFPARKDIMRDGDRPSHVHLMISGWACKYNIVADGRRQITAFLLPGDLCNARASLLRKSDHGIGAVTSVKAAIISPSAMDELLDRPLIARALLLAGLVDESALRASIVSLGKRDASKRVAHLICELFVRLDNIGQARPDGFDCPLTQEEIGDAIGLTPVHVNRVVRQLRETELLSIKNRFVDIPDLSKLQKAAGFNPDYLCVNK